MTMPLVYEENKAWSTLSLKPVIFNEYMCFWDGIFMHKNTALCVTANKLMHIPVTPEQTQSLWNSTHDMLKVAKRDGYSPEFNLDDYTPSRLINYIANRIVNSVFYMDGPVKWTPTPFEVVEYFFINK